MAIQCNITTLPYRLLIDQDRDGRINKAEFCAGIHLISFARQGGALPLMLPQWLLVESQVINVQLCDALCIF